MTKVIGNWTTVVLKGRIHFVEDARFPAPGLQDLQSCRFIRISGRMKHNPRSKVVDLLMDTLERVEERPCPRPDEAAMEKLKQNVFRLVAQFEAVRRHEGVPASE